jgi:PEP-CTERM motif
MNIKTVFSACAAAIALEAFGLGDAVAANLLSGDVDIANYYPNLSTPFDSVQGSGPTTSVITLNDSGYHFEFTADTIIFTNPYSNPWGVTPPGGFNGFVLIFSGIPAISDVLNDSNSTLAPPSLTFNRDTIWMNYPSGGARSDGAFTTLDVSFSAVPEPSTWALLIVGFAGIALVAYRRRRAPQPPLDWGDKRLLKGAALYNMELDVKTPGS